MKHVLIVEDEVTLADAMRDKLSKANIGVHVVHTGSDAITRIKERAESAPFDLILLDLLIPDQNGFDVIETLHTDKIDIPIVILTNLSKDEYQERIVGDSVVDYLVKSDTSIDLLLEKVQSIVN